MTVFVVTVSDYLLDKHNEILGIFSTHKKAQDFIDGLIDKEDKEYAETNLWEVQ